MTKRTRFLGLLAMAILTPLMALAPLAASAASVSVVGVSSSGGSTSLLSAGDVLTVDLVVDNATNLDLYGLGLAAFGYDPDQNGLADDGLVLAGGLVAGSLFNEVLLPGPIAVGGLENVRTAPVEQGGHDLFFGNHDELRASLFDGVSLSPSNGDGSLDVGVGGDTIANGDIHFQIQFQATSIPSARTFTLQFGTAPQFGAVAVGAGGSLLPFTNDSLVVTVVPEPGTALLLGLGLCGLAAGGRRVARAAD